MPDNHICPQICSSPLLSLTSLIPTFHHFMWSAAVEVVRVFAFSLHYVAFIPQTFTTRYGPRNFECSFNPRPPCILSIATRSPVLYVVAFLRLLLNVCLFRGWISSIHPLAFIRNWSRFSWNIATYSSSTSCLICRSSRILIRVPNNNWNGVTLVLLLGVAFKYLCTFSRCLNHSSGVGADNFVGIPVVVRTCSVPSLLQ